MKKIIATSVLFTLSSAALALQLPVTNEHKPNAHTMACLEAPTRDCAFTAALQTVINEEFGIERAKVLIGIARSMIATGQNKQAIQTLVLALDEARSVNLSLVTREKITEIAPLLARAGDTAGALALVEELERPVLKDRVLFEIASEAGSTGAIADARVTLAQTQNQTRAFWRELRILAHSSKKILASVKMEELLEKVRTADRVELQYGGLIQLAIIADRLGLPGERNALITEADELFLSVISIHQRAASTADRARNMFEAGMAPVFIDESYALAMKHGKRLRGNEVQSSFADKVGVIEAASGSLELALSRLDVFVDVAAKAKYLSQLRASRDQSLLTAEIKEILKQVTEIEGAYDRDLVRLTLLDGAIANEDAFLAQVIVVAVEDDDNQAYGLALMAPLLE
ncbi:MAG: hypothetical protein JKY34_15740 [Kordiimonadaceae bacterium]|nr:hypothetical protein [Kordiimonadaceae bacterium]